MDAGKEAEEIKVTHPAVAADVVFVVLAACYLGFKPQKLCCLFFLYFFPLVPTSSLV